jgi:hypothetical protein
MKKTHRTGRPQKIFAMISAFLIAFALIFGQTAAAAANPLSAAVTAPQGMEFTLSLEPDASGGLIPPDVAEILNGLGLRVLMTSDFTNAENIRMFANLGLLRNENEALSVQALIDNGDIFVHVPQLLPDVYKIDFGALLEEAGAGVSMDLDNLNLFGAGLAGLTLEDLGATIQGFIGVIDANLPAATDDGIQTFTVAGKSADYTIMTRIASGADLKNLLMSVINFLETDKGFNAIYDIFLKEQANGQEYAEFISLLKEQLETASPEDDAGFAYQYLVDENGTTMGYALSLLDGDTQKSITLINVRDGDQNNLEFKVFDESDDYFVLTLTFNLVENGIDGTFYVESEGIDFLVQGLSGTFKALNVDTVEIEGVEYPVGNFELGITPPGETNPVIITLDITGAGDRINGVLNIPGLVKINIVARPLPAAEAVVPTITGNIVEITSASDFESLMDENLMNNIMTVMSELGLEGLMEQMMPMPQEMEPAATSAP